MADESVSRWLEQLKEGSDEAKANLWRRYHSRLVGLARTFLAGTSRRVADEEDVALEAFEKFFRAAEAGHFPRLEDRDDLWRILVTITEHRAIDQRRELGAEKRGGGHVRGDSAFGDAVDAIAAVEPTPAFAAEVAEEFGRLLAKLGDDELRRIAVMKFEGRSNAEIAAELRVALATVERRLARIRREWRDER